MQFKKNLAQVEKQDCPCGLSRRPFEGQTDAYAIGSFHGTIFTSEKRAFPHFHVEAPKQDRATRETYFVTDEDTKPDSYIYLGGTGSVKAKPGVLVEVYPGIVHGGTGDFTPLILGVPGFEDEGVIEIEDERGIKAFYESGLRNITTPPTYHEKSGFFKLSAEKPTLSFEELYNEANLHIVLAQQEKLGLSAGAFKSNQLKPQGFKESNGPTYVMVRSGDGRIKVEGKDVLVRSLDVLLTQNEEITIGPGLATTIMAVNPTSLDSLVPGASLTI